MKDVNNLLEHLKRIEVYRIPGSDGPMMASVCKETLVRTIAGIEQLKRERDEARAKALEEAAKVAAWACMVPPDGGSPTDAERAVADAAAAAIRDLKLQS